MNKEKDVKLAIKAVFQKYNAYFFMPAQNGYGRAGIPDFIACLNGQFIGVEAKFGKNGASPHQVREMNEINLHGGVAMVVNENNLCELDNVLATIAHS